MPLPVCSPGAQRCFHWLCGALACLGGYVYAGGWHTMGVVFWHSLYVGVCRVLQQRDDDAAVRGREAYWGALLEGYPRWSYLVALLNGGAVMPAMLWCAARATTGSGSLLGGVDEVGFLLPPPQPGSTASFFIAQGNAALCAGMLKDFVVYPQGLELHFAAHHFATVLGNIVCLALPTGVGLAAVNSVVAELGSQCYNVDVLVAGSSGGGGKSGGSFSPGAKRVAKAAHVLGMTISNGVIVWLALRLWALNNTPIWLRGTYAVLCTFIVLMRVVGTLLTLQALLAPPAVAAMTRTETVQTQQAPKKRD